MAYEEQLQVYQSFVDILRKRNMQMDYVAEKYGINFFTLRNQIHLCKRGEASEYVYEKMCELVKKLNLSRKVFPRKCVVCGKPYHLKNLSNVRQKTCSPKCQREAKLLWKKQYDLENPNMDEFFLECQICGKTFKGTRRRKYCSVECRRIGRSKHNCLYCGKPISAKRKYCSHDCQYEHMLILKEEKRKEELLQKDPNIGWGNIDKINNTLANLQNGLY